MAGSRFRIAVLGGDGIGPEVVASGRAVLAEACRLAGGPALSFDELDAGAGCYVRTGTALPEETIRRAEAADAILLGAMGLPHIRYPDGREIAPQVDLRDIFALYAGVRPVRSTPGLPPVLADPRAGHLDFVLIREQTEGLFARRNEGRLEGDAAASDTLVITRPATARAARFAFALARSRARERGRPGHVTCIDKANVLSSMAFFRKVFDETAAEFPDIGVRHLYVDAAALNLVRQPWSLDVAVTENLFGDILSDLGAGLIGGMGMAPSADIGERRAVFQPCHGTAPDIAGRGLANPTAMILSAAMMLEWLAERSGEPAAATAGRMIRDAVDAAFSGGNLLPAEFGGPAGTQAVTDAVLAALRTAGAAAA